MAKHGFSERFFTGHFKGPGTKEVHKDNHDWRNNPCHKEPGASQSHHLGKEYLSAKKARDLLGWRPKYTLEESLKETIDWYAEFLKQ